MDNIKITALAHTEGGNGPAEYSALLHPHMCETCIVSPFEHAAAMEIRDHGRHIDTCREEAPLNKFNVCNARRVNNSLRKSQSMDDLRVHTHSGS